MSWVSVCRELCVDSPVLRVASVGTALRSVSVTMEEPVLPLQESVFAVQDTLERGEAQALLFCENLFILLKMYKHKMTIT